MSNFIKDGKGRGYLVGVTENNKLLVDAYSKTIQFTISEEFGQAYQVIGTIPIVSGKNVGLFIKNVDPTRNLVITYHRHQILDLSGGTEVPNSNNYFSFSLNDSYVSGGTELKAINMRQGSGNDAVIESYKSPILSNTGKEIDRWYTKSLGDMNTYNKEGSVILNYGNTLDMSYYSDNTSGLFSFRISFLMVEN